MAKASTFWDFYILLYVSLCPGDTLETAGKAALTSSGWDRLFVEGLRGLACVLPG